MLKSNNIVRWGATPRRRALACLGFGDLGLVFGHFCRKSAGETSSPAEPMNTGDDVPPVDFLQREGRINTG